MVPRWLKGNISPNPALIGEGYKLLTCYGTLLDAQGDALTAGLQASFPGYGDDYSLDLLGQQRGITRGFLESSTAYATRLQFWRQCNRRKGNAWAMMEQVQAMLQGYPVQVRVICGDGTASNPATRYTLAAGGYVYNGDYLTSAPSGTAVIDQTPSNWNWGFQDPNSPFINHNSGTDGDQCRFWVLLYGHPWTRDGIWTGSGIWNDLDTSDGTSGGTPLDPYQVGQPTPDLNPTYGSTASFSSVQSILNVVRQWAPPNSSPQQVIVCFDSTSFNTFTPAGNWNLPGERDPSFVYWQV
jgi:hypothetical protein